MRCSNNADSFRTISLPDLNLKGSAQQRQMAVIGTHCGIAQIGQWKLSGVGAGCCGEPMFDNAGSQNSLLEDREACAMELEKSPAAIVYRQNPTAHPEYVSQVFEEMNRCIGRKGWKQVRSQQEQEQVREAITSELAQTGQPAPRSDPKTSESFVRAVEDRLARPSSSVQSATRKD